MAGGDPGYMLWEGIPRIRPCGDPGVRHFMRTAIWGRAICPRVQTWYLFQATELKGNEANKLHLLRENIDFLLVRSFKKTDPCILDENRKIHLFVMKMIPSGVEFYAEFDF